MPDPLIDRYRQGDRQALARLLTQASRGQLPAGVMDALPAPHRPARVIAITGSAGVGKSTLIGQLIPILREQQLRVAVLACDPQSPLTGGALLGDRFRMPVRPEDDGVFIRSVAAEAGAGAVAEHLPELIVLLEGFGFDVVLVETVGAGQGDTAVRASADVLVLLLQPQTGDELQWEKAGLVEVADLIVIHKSDLPGAEAIEGQVKTMVSLAGGKAPLVLRTSAKTGGGLHELARAILACEAGRTSRPPELGALLRLVRGAVAMRLAQWAQPDRPELRTIASQWLHGAISADAAVTRVLHLLVGTDDSKNAS